MLNNDYPEVVRETDTYVDFKVNPSYFSKPTTREKKFLCVGGPLNGEYYSRTQVNYATMLGLYREFNRSGASRHSVIFAWNTEES